MVEPKVSNRKRYRLLVLSPFCFVFIIGLVLLFSMTLDVVLQQGWLIAPDVYNSNKLILSVRLSEFMGLSAFFVSVLFYIRIRFFNNSFSATPMIHKALLRGYSRRRWIARSIIGLVIGIICLFLPHMLVVRLVLHYEMQNSLGFILFTQLFQLMGHAGGAMIFTLHALQLEKVLFHFSAFEADLVKFDV